MPNLTKLLTKLERYDTFPAQDALSKALDDCLADENTIPQALDAGAVLWNNFIHSQGAPAWDLLVRWADERLTAWHSLKVNALEAAWHADNTGEDYEYMRQQILINLRQGINDEPALLADAHFLQALALQKHSFSFVQAIRELRAEGFAFPPDDKALIRHCVICVNAFMYLIPQQG